MIGASGSGKTTLMAAIAQRIQNNVQGEVYLNERRVSPRELRSCSAFVPQADVLLDSLTPLEHMRFLAKLKFGDSHSEETEQKILEIFMLLGLFSVSTTHIQRLSGGQRRKLMLAGELLSDPKILICDEPTTGLDSFSAASVIKSLRQLAGIPEDVVRQDQLVQLPSATSRIVMCSIHQPSSELFHHFTNIILVQGGRVVFQGTLQVSGLLYPL